MGSDTVFDNGIVQLYKADARSLPIPDNSVDCVVTSPPYWGLRDYGTGDAQIGLEKSMEGYCSTMVQVFREVWRVLKPTGTVWLNLGDSYAGSGRGPSRWNPAQEMQSDQTPPKGLKPKDLCGIPWRVAFALQADGWYLRSDIIWSKPNPMPESVSDRPTKAHEYVFLLTKSPKYYYDADAIREPNTWIESRPSGMQRNAEQYRNKVYGKQSTKYTDSTYGGGGTSFSGHSGHYKSDGSLIDNPLGRNKRSVWEITTQPYPEAHFATYPESLVSPCILAGTSEKGVCAECGNPWVRESIVTNVPERETRDNRIGVIPGRDHASRMNSKAMVKVDREFTGWKPTCDCDAEAVPATVLDPFIGSGTTAAVAQKLGRRGVGADISGDYLKLASKRIGSISLPMF